MSARLAVTTVVSLALMQGAAFAQSGTSSNKATGSSAQNAQQNQTAQNLPQEIRQKLTSQGYTDVKVVPGSFLVSAQDKDGDPVTMVIGPHSMTVFTVSSADSATTGSGSDSSAMNKDSSANKNSSANK